MRERHLVAPPELLVRTDKRGGSHTYILYTPPLESFLHEKYGREGLCLKVFKAPATDLNTFVWNPDILLTSCTKIQNLFALRGLAPRVYDIVLLEETSWAQVTDFVGNAEPPTTSFTSKDVMGEFYISANWDMNEKNWVNGYLVDFGAFYWRDPSRYEERLKERINRYATWGSNPLPYQSAFGLPAQRDMGYRVEMMKLDEADFSGKTVLDLGCSLGLFCHDALERGASRVVGVDRGVERMETCYEVANWLGYWNIDFVDISLPRSKPWVRVIAGLGRFDIIYALSVDRQIGYAPWMAEMCSDVFYLEGHVPDREHTYREQLEADFSKVEYLGMTRDHGPRPLFRCWK